MSEPWLNFVIVISVQFLVFIAYAYYAKKLSKVPSILAKGILIGIVFGLSFDFIFGELLGFHSYVLGFGISFLILNAAISYGLFSATILLLERIQFPYFYIWTILIMAIYEITNFFFPVWHWKLTLPSIQFLFVLIIGYLCGAIVIIGINARLRILQHLKG